jgi:hypothetical protein
MKLTPRRQEMKESDLLFGESQVADVDKLSFMAG